MTPHSQDIANIDISTHDHASRDALMAANINPDTYLATDYLNHFNEVIMALDMLPTMPEIAEEVINWQPTSYKQHFQNSAFMGKELAIAAYDLVPALLKSRFEEIIVTLDTALVEAQMELRTGLESGDVSRIQAITTETLDMVKPLIEAAGSIINGIDIPDTLSEAEHSDVHNQADIDELFD